MRTQDGCKDDQYCSHGPAGQVYLKQVSGFCLMRIAQLPAIVVIAIDLFSHAHPGACTFMLHCQWAHRFVVSSLELALCIMSERFCCTVKVDDAVDLVQHISCALQPNKSDRMCHLVALPLRP